MPVSYSVDTFIEQEMEQIERDKEKKGSQSQDSSSSDNADAAATGGSGFNWKAISSVPSLFSPDLWILQFTISWILHLFKGLGHNKLDKYVSLEEKGEEMNDNDDNSSSSSSSNNNSSDSDGNEDQDADKVKKDDDGEGDEVAIIDISNASDVDSDVGSDEDKFDVNASVIAIDKLLSQRTGAYPSPKIASKNTKNKRKKKKKKKKDGASEHIASATTPVSDRFEYKSAIFDLFRRNKDEELVETLAWIDKQKRGIPTYYMLCRMVKAEMIRTISNVFGVKHEALSFFLSVIAYLIPFSHVLTGVGVLNWFLVAEKYLIFLFVSVGIWVKPCVDGYDLNGESLAGLEDVEYNNDNDPDHNLRGFYMFVTESVEGGFGA